MKKFFISLLSILIFSSIILNAAVPLASAATIPTGRLSALFGQSVWFWTWPEHKYLNDYAMMYRVYEDYEDIFWEKMDSELPEDHDIFENGLKVPAAEYEEKLYKYFDVSDFWLEYIREYSQYDPVAQTYTIQFMGGWGGAPSARAYSGFVDCGDYYEIYLCDYEYLSLQDLLPESVTLDDFLSSLDYPSELVYEGYFFDDFGNYEIAIGFKNSGLVLRAELNGTTVRFLSIDEFTAEDMPEKFADSPDAPVSCTSSAGVTVDVGNAFLPGTNVSVEIVESEKAANAIKNISRSYTVFEINASIDVMLYQPRESVTVTFPLPEGYSNDVALFYMNNRGVLTDLDIFFDAENRTVSAILDHFSAYILADLSADPSITIPGDVNNDGEVNIRDSATILLYLSGKAVECNADAIDTNGDGKIDTADVEYLLKNITEHTDAELNFGLSCEHSLKKTEAVPSTYFTEGVIEYWTCEKCNLMFKDAAAKTLITPAATKAPLLDIVPSEGMRFVLNEDGKSYSVAGLGSCMDKDIVIPSTYEGLPVTKIEPEAFFLMDIRSIYIPSSVKVIGEDAFSSCLELQNVYFNQGLEIIENGAFRNCRALVSAILPEGLKTIGNYAFASSGIKTISFPKSVESIGASVVERTDLNTITVAEGNPYYSSNGNCLIEKATKTLIAGCAYTVIPTDGSVTTIGTEAFYDCESLKSIVISEGITKIEEGAFDLCENLESVYLPASLEVMNGNPFLRCTSIKSIVLNENNKTFHTAGNCIIETATKTLLIGCMNSVIPADGSVTVIGDGAFSAQTGLTSLVIPDCVTKIGRAAFSYCMGLTSINIPEGIEEIPTAAFYGCIEITNITIPSSVKKIGEYAFGAMLSLKSINIPASVIEIEGNPFEDTIYLENLTVDAGNAYYTAKGNCLIEKATKTIIAGFASSIIPDDGSVEVIGDRAFCFQTEMTTVTLPASIKKFGDFCFGGCSNLETVIFAGTAEEWSLIEKHPDWNKNSKFKYDNNIIFLIDNSSKGLEFKLISDGTAYSVIGIGTCTDTDIIIPSIYKGLPVTEIGVCAFESTEIVSIYIPSSVKTIKRAAFQYCEYLETITLSEGLQTIKEYAFASTVIKSITLPKSLELVEAFAFEYTLLESIEIADGNRNYIVAGNCLIEKATKTLVAGCLNSVIPTDGSITVIGDGAFSGFVDLQSIVIPEGVTRIGDYAFGSCMSLTSINIPEGVVELGTCAFIGCSGIETLTLPSTLKKIGDAALGAMYEVKEVVIPAGVTEILGNPFYENALESIKVEEGNKFYHTANNCLIETATKTLISGCYTSVIPADGSVTNIGYEAFASLELLTTITIPNCIKEIGDYAFNNNWSLETFIFEGTEEEWEAVIKGDFWNQDCPFTEVTFSGGHTHSTVTVSGTPAGERSFGTSDYVYCSACSEILSEQTVTLPLGIENPDYYASNWGYEYLATLPNGANMQQFYLALDEEIKDFHVNTNRIPDENGYLNPVRYDVFGLSDDEARTVYSIYKDDHPLYYWISNSSAIYPGVSFLVMVDEEYVNSSVREYYNNLVYDVAADYLMLTINEKSEYQIAWALHDAICLNGKYAYKADGTTPESASWAHSIIGMIEKNAGVCESYTEVFGLLLNFSGVENIRVSGKGNGGNHAWNLVKLDNGEWYWYDLTWDDRDTNNIYEIWQGYAAVTDYQNVTVKIGGGSFETVYFFKQHTPGANYNYGINYTPVLPERASNAFTTDDTMIYETFTYEGTTYQVIRFDTVYCSPYLGIGSTPPETITYNGREYKVIVDN